jgi:hypothetical protein
MTLGELFRFLGENPTYITGYFLLIPTLALVANWIAGEEGRQSPWIFMYSALVFAACVPGVFSVGLSVYHFLFERGSIMNTNVLTQILPVLSMVLTITVIKRNVELSHVPGSERISSLMMLIAAVLVLMYVLDRTRLFVMVSLTVWQFLFVLIGLLLVVRYATKKIMA